MVYNHIMENLKTYTYGPASGSEPKSVIIMLHGLGADGRDLISLGPELAKTLPDTLFVSPDAPYHCDMAPMGRQWFSLQDWSPSNILAGVKNAAPYVYNLIDQLKTQYNLPTAKFGLLGFSQGSMMSMFVGTRYPEEIAGIVAYSGALVWDDMPVAEIRKPPVCLIHGYMDNIVPIAQYFAAKETLEKAGIDVSGHASPMLMHSIDFQGIQAAQDFFKARFDKGAE
jgi:phospholipase/carboxylesterase